MKPLAELSWFQRIIIVLVLTGAVVAVTGVVRSVTTGQYAVAVAWFTVLVGCGLIWTAAGAIEYFRTQERLVGGSWILRIFLRTSIAVTFISMYFTVARVVTLVFGSQPMVQVLSGVAIIILLLIPKIMQIVFEQHEGRRQ